MEAVAGVKEPREWITLPYRGCMRARRSHMPEKTEEYTESMIIEMESQLARFRWISCLVGQPSIKLFWSLSVMLPWKLRMSLVILSSGKLT
jgi:hypothetical protein